MILYAVRTDAAASGEIESVKIAATEYGKRHIMSKECRGILERIAAQQRIVGWSPQESRYMLSILVTTWLPLPSKNGANPFAVDDGITHLDEFIAENQKLIDAAIVGLWE